MKRPFRIKNFMSKEDTSSFIQYMDENYLSWTNSQELIYTRRFGRNNLEFKQSEKDLKMENMDHMESDLIKSLMFKYAGKFEEEVRSIYNDSSDLYISEFWLCKRLKGASQGLHSDIDNGNNNHIKYSGIIYLNSLFIGGEIFFPSISYTYTPKAGEVIVFESRDKDFDHGVYPSPHERYSMPIWLSDNPDYSLMK